MGQKHLITGVFAALCSTAIMAAQAPAPQSPDSRPAPAAAPQVSTQKSAATTLVGCVYREKDVPGRAPNVAERAGILEDYIFAEAPSAPIASATATPRPGQTAGAVGTSGALGAMYKLEFVDGDKLKSMVGKRVEITGRIDAEAGDSPAPAADAKTTTVDKVLGHDRVNLSEFEVSSIKEVAGTCPATPDPKP